MPAKKKEVTSRDIQKEIISHMRSPSKHNLWHDINKLVTIVLVLCVLVYGALLLFAYSSVEDKGFFSYEEGKRFYAFSSCDFDKKIHCFYHTRIHNVTTLHLENNYPYPLKIFNARTKHCVMMRNISVKGAAAFNLTMNCTSYNPSVSDLTISYVNVESTLIHQTKGKIKSHFEVTAMFKILNDITEFFDANVELMDSSIEEKNS